MAKKSTTAKPTAKSPKKPAKTQAKKKPSAKPAAKKKPAKPKAKKPKSTAKVATGKTIKSIVENIMWVVLGAGIALALFVAAVAVGHYLAAPTPIPAPTAMPTRVTRAATMTEATAAPAKAVEAKVTVVSTARHPSFYQETGPGKTAILSFKVNPGEVGIIGGYCVEGICDGVYKAVKDGIYHPKVTDGFVLVIPEEFAQEEFCYRIHLAEKNNWARSHLEPLIEWGEKPCE